MGMSPYFWPKNSSMLAAAIIITISCATTSQAKEENGCTFTAIFSRSLRSNSSYKVWLSGHNDRQPKPLQLTLQCLTAIQTRTEISTDSIDLGVNEFKSVELSVPATLNPKSHDSCALLVKDWNTQAELDKAQLTLKASAVGTAGTAGQEELEAGSLFIQLDKPAYKPGEVIRVRVIALNENDLPTSDLAVNITIRNSKNQILHKLTNHRPDAEAHGLTNFSFPLSTQTALGVWKIWAESGAVETEQTFLIAKYALSKFYPKLTLTPPFLTAQDDPIVTVKVQGLYTYGKNVVGSCTISLLNSLGHRLSNDSGVDEQAANLTASQGKASFTFDLRRYKVHTRAGESYKVIANVTEISTGRWEVGSSIIKIYESDRYDITWLNPVDSFKPGFPLNLKMAVSDSNRLPVSDKNLTALTLEAVTYGSGPKTSHHFMPIPDTGIVTFVVPISSDVSSIQSLVVGYKRVKLEISPLPQLFVSTSNIFMDVTPRYSTLTSFERNRSYQFRVILSQRISPRINYILVTSSTGTIVSFQGGLQPSWRRSSTRQYEGNIDVFLPAERYTDLTLLVYFAHAASTNEIISASTTIPTNNFVHLELSGRSMQPAESMTFTFTTHPNSVIGIRGIDQSVLLLSQDQNDNDIDPGSVRHSTRFMTDSSSPLSLMSSATTTSMSGFYKQFLTAGLSLLTDGLVIDGGDRLMVSKVNGDLTSASVGRRRRSSTLRTFNNPVEESMIDQKFFDGAIRTRTHFPETWLWQILSVNESSDGMVEVQSSGPVVPDTITSWFFTAFSLNPDTGFGVTPFPTVLNVFRPFFVTLNLPYSLIKGDTFHLQVIVHNYLGKQVWAEVTFENHENKFQLVGSEESKMENVTKRVLVGSEEVGAVGFVMTVLEVGQEVPIRVRAVADTAGDAIVRNILVLPPDEKEFIKDIVIVQNPIGAGQDHRLRHVIQGQSQLRHSGGKNDTNPEEDDLESFTECVITICGDPMATYKPTDVGDLISLPVGCGEQSMPAFIKNVWALNYLKSVNKLTPQILEKGITNLQEGYQKQLTYWYGDSFKFQDSDSKRSTWLTAYILRCFVSARQFITIDDSIVINGLKFLLRRQQARTGQFLEDSKFIYSTFRDQRTKLTNETDQFAYGLTAYVVNALLEIKESRDGLPIDKKLKRSMEKGILTGLRFISSETARLYSDPYSLSIVTMTLYHARHTNRQDFFTQLEAYARTTHEGEYKHWETTKASQPAATSSGFASAITVEMTAYGLLTYLFKAKESKANAMPIVRWLVSQRSPKGGFRSTQDTAVALMALGKFATMTSMGVGQSDDVVELEIRTDTNETLNVRVTRDNSMVLQTFDLNMVAQWLDITMNGSGKFLLEYTETRYKGPRANGMDDDQYFQIRTMWRPMVNYMMGVFSLEICVRVNPAYKERTERSTANIQIASGYWFDPRLTRKKRGKAKSYPVNVENDEFKLGNSVAQIHYAYLTTNDTCVHLVAERIQMVASNYMAKIEVTEYYNPDVSGRAMYGAVNRTTSCDICLQTMDCDQVQGC